MKRNVIVLTAALCVTVSASLFAQQQSTLPAYENPDLHIEQRVDDLVSHMTLEEKVSHAGHMAEAIPRLGVPNYNWWNEGLHGVARARNATVFPQAIGMAATFDEPLMRQISDVISTEFRAKYYAALRLDGSSAWYRGLTVWSPNINIFRDPRWGRGQEPTARIPILLRALASLSSPACKEMTIVFEDSCDIKALRGAQRSGNDAPHGRRASFATRHGGHLSSSLPGNRHRS
jgi:beta-glucosidase